MFMCDVTHVCVWHDSCLVKYTHTMRDLTHKCLMCDLSDITLIYLDIIFHMWLMCDMTQIFLWDMIHASWGEYRLFVTWFMWLCVTWPMPREVYTHYVCVMTHFYVWHGSCLVKCTHTACDVTHMSIYDMSYASSSIHTLCVTWHTICIYNMTDTLYRAHSLCVTWHMSTCHIRYDTWDAHTHTHTYMTHDLWGMGWSRLVGSLKS